MNSIRETLAVLLAGFSLLSVNAAAAQDTFVVSSRFLNVLVDIDHCESTSSLCSGSGSVGAAAGGNDSIVAFHIQVNGPLGNPVGGLLETDFVLSGVTNQVPGVTPAFVDTVTCPACFAEPEQGVYRLAVRPSSFDWGAGSYVVQLEVTVPSGSVRQIPVSIDIPN